MPEVQIIGGGPAAIAALAARENSGEDPETAVIFGGGFGGGSDFPGSDIFSNSAGSEMIPPGFQNSNLQTPNPVSLDAVAEYYRVLGRYFLEQNGIFPIQKWAGKIALSEDGATVFDAAGDIISEARETIIAIGSEQVPLLAAEKLILSGDFLKKGAPIPDERVAIVGGSHSAFSALERLLRYGKNPGEIIIVVRSVVKVFWESVAEARENGENPDPKSICTETGRVNRFDGIRGAAREAYLRLLKDFPRNIVSPNETNFYDFDAVIQAFGYFPREIPVFDESGNEISFLKNAAGEYVTDRFGHLLLAENSKPVHHLYRLGLGSGQKIPNSDRVFPHFQSYAAAANNFFSFLTQNERR